MPAERIEVGTLLRGRGSAGRLHEIARKIRSGAVFVYPTETIYGIGGMFGCPGVRRRIVSAKHRPSHEPMILIAGHRRLFDAAVGVMPPAAHALASHFWPGRLTLVVPSSAGDGFTGIRESDHPFLVRLADEVPRPLYSTSANLSGEDYRNDPVLISSIFGGKVDFIISAGALPPSPPSSVVKVKRDGSVEVLRVGTVGEDEIARVLAESTTPR